MHRPSDYPVLLLRLALILSSWLFLSWVDLNDPAEPTLTAGEAADEEISDWQARLELARVLSYLKRYDESLKEYHILLQAQPNSVPARAEMARILFYQAQTEAALNELAKIPTQELDDATWLLIADIQRKQKNYAEAERIYAQYLKKFPEEDRVRLRLADLLSWQKRYQESINEYRLILSRHPEDIQVRRRYARVLTWMGNDEEAIKEWKKTLS